MKLIRLHPPLLLAIQQGVIDILQKGEHADKYVPKILQQHKKWGSRDRALVAETLYDIVRWYRKYLYLSKHIEDWSSEFVDAIIHISLLERGYTISEETIKETITSEEVLPHAILASIPDWLEERGSKELGTTWLSIMEALNVPALTFIRVNTLKQKTEAVQKALVKEQIETIPVSNHPEALQVVGKNKLRQHLLFRQGVFEFQDIASIAVGDFCDIKPGQVIADVCAGKGGKTLHLSALLNNTGKIYASDIDSTRLEILAERAEKAGCKNVKPVFAEDLLKKKVDVLLIDAPCSALGTLKRNPDLKWKSTNEQIEAMIAIQQQILEQYVDIVKPAGCIVYATCSILPSEGELQIINFLKKHSDFTLEEEKRYCPAKDGYDGFYMARLRRKA